MSHPKDQEPKTSAAPAEALETEALDEVVGGSRTSVKDSHDTYPNPAPAPTTLG